MYKIINHVPTKLFIKDMNRGRTVDMKNDTIVYSLYDIANPCDVLRTV